MSRKLVLGNIIKALTKGKTLNINRRTEASERLKRPRANLVPARARQPREELLAMFRSELTAHAIDVLEAAGTSDIPLLAAAYLKKQGLPPKLRCGDDKLLALVPWTTSVEITRGAAGRDDRAAMSLAAAGVAETGTLVLCSGADNPATLAFLPEVHLVLVLEDEIVGSYEDAFELVRAKCGSSILPRSVNLISGPSRTGDIGGRIVLGAHGPRRLAVIIVKVTRETAQRPRQD
jgi:L-lactate dehydrogenase complex protein LldG